MVVSGHVKNGTNMLNDCVTLSEGVAVWLTVAAAETQQSTEGPRCRTGWRVLSK
jgi:hypothetical protein